MRVGMGLLAHIPVALGDGEESKELSLFKDLRIRRVKD
jgi:hypothetical protein